MLYSSFVCYRSGGLLESAFDNSEAALLEGTESHTIDDGGLRSMLYHLLG